MSGMNIWPLPLQEQSCVGVFWVSIVTVETIGLGSCARVRLGWRDSLGRGRLVGSRSVCVGLVVRGQGIG